MPTVPLHPALVHVPLGMAFVIPIVAIGLVLALWRGLVTRRAFALAVVLQLLLLAGGIAAMKAGERDADRVTPRLSERLVEDHEERAEAFLWAAAAVLGLGIAALAVPARLARPLVAVTAAGTLAVAALAYRTGKAGGELVYVHGAGMSGADGLAGAATPDGHERD